MLNSSTHTQPDDEMHILFLNPVAVIGGAERVLLATVSSIRRLRSSWRCSAVLFDDGPLVDELTELGVDVHVVALPLAFRQLGDTQLRTHHRALLRVSRLAWKTIENSPAAWTFLRRLRRVFRELKPQLIHSNGMKAHVLSGIAAPNDVRLTWHLHDFCSQRPLMAKVLRRVARNVHGSIAVSDAVKIDSQRVLPAMPITVVKNAVDTHQFNPTDKNSAELDRLANFGLDPCEAVRVGMIATYANWKGQDVFLDAVARLPRSIRTYIIGGPIYDTAASQFTEIDLQHRAAELGISERVGFVPFQANPARVYQMLDIVVHASTRPEPFGLTIAEGMACGRAMVVARAGGAAEICTHNFDALTHQPGSVVELADAIKRLASDPELRKRLGTNARSTAVANFNLSRFATELVSFFENSRNNLRAAG